MKLSCSYGERDFVECRVSEMGNLIVELTDSDTKAKVILNPEQARKLRKFLKKKFPKTTAGVRNEHSDS